ncbi:MAG: Gmad2 immunoglobulin-like domain-containing protein [Sporichthyaceae bacterium]
MTSPDPELERMLRATLQNEAARVTPAGDGLARIRARTSASTGFARLFRPALAGAALTFTLVAGTLIGINMNDDGGRTELAQPAATGGPAALDPPATKVPPAVKDPATEPKTLLPPPVATTQPSPEPTLGTRIAVTAPPTGLATPAAECVADTTVPADDGGNYIAIASPGSGCPLDGPSITVSGTARVFEAALSIDVLQNGLVLHTANVTASIGAPELGTWSTMFSLKPGNYRIEGYYLSAEDGSRKVLDTIWISIR